MRVMWPHFPYYLDLGGDSSLNEGFAALDSSLWQRADGIRNVNLSHHWKWNHWSWAKWQYHCLHQTNLHIGSNGSSVPVTCRVSSLAEHDSMTPISSNSITREPNSESMGIQSYKVSYYRPHTITNQYTECSIEIHSNTHVCNALMLSWVMMQSVWGIWSVEYKGNSTWQMSICHR